MPSLGLDTNIGEGHRGLRWELSVGNLDIEGEKNTVRSLAYHHLSLHWRQDIRGTDHSSTPIWEELHLAVSVDKDGMEMDFEGNGHRRRRRRIARRSARHHQPRSR